MIKKIMMLHIFLVGLYGVVHGALQPITNGQTIGINASGGLTSLSFLSSDGSKTEVDITKILSQLSATIKGIFSTHNPVTFTVQAQNMGGTFERYSLEVSSGTIQNVPISTLQGVPNFEMFYNEVSSGYYFGPGVAQFSIINSAPILVSVPQLNSLTVVSSDGKTTTLDITTPLSALKDSSVQTSFNAGSAIYFALSVGAGEQYYLYVTSAKESEKSLLGALQGSPDFEMFCNGTSIGRYFGPGVANFSIVRYPVVTITTADATTNSCYSGSTYPCPYVIPNLGQYFTEITAMSFVQKSGAQKTYSLNAAQISDINAYYQKMSPNSEVSIRVVHSAISDEISLLMAGAAPYPLCSIPNAKGMGFPIEFYINNVLVSTVGAVTHTATVDGNLFAVLKK